MILLPPRATRTDTLVPDTTSVRSGRFLLLWGQCLRLVAAEVGDRAAPAFGRTSLADVTAVEDQPVMCADAKRRGHLPFELLLDRKHGLSGRKAGAVADAEDMGIDRKGLRPDGRSAERRVGQECVSTYRSRW